MKKVVSYTMGVLWALCALLASIAIMVEYWTYNDAFFYNQYASYDAARVIGVTDDELKLVTNVLQEYLAGKRDTLDVEVQRAGQTQQFFNEREKDHMVDVLVLFRFERAVRWASLALLVVLTLGLYLLEKKNMGAVWAKACLWTLGSILAVALLVVGLVAIDFERAWHFLHTLVFSNDLWLLDPSTDMLINLVPLPFFIGISTRIGLGVAGLIGLVLFAAVVVLRGEKQPAAHAVAEPQSLPAEGNTP